MASDRKRRGRRERDSLAAGEMRSPAPPSPAPSTSSSASGEWLEKALAELSGRMESALILDADLIAGLVSFCELAPPPDAADYLSNIIGLEASQSIIQEYLKRRGHHGSSAGNQDIGTSNIQAYVKPRADQAVAAVKKEIGVSREIKYSITKGSSDQTENTDPRSNLKGNPSSTRKKKGAKVSLAEASKGSIVFNQGKPCSCQARRHKLVSNCLSCGKIVCEQEGEGPCSFCGSLVLREGSSYAGLDGLTAPVSEAEASAEAYAKRLVDYDRNSAARTKVIDDQSDYYEFEGNSWLSPEERQALQQKQKEIEEAAEAQRAKVIVSFDLLGRKVMVSGDDNSAELVTEYSVLRPLEEKDSNRIKPNPTVGLMPTFVDPGPRKIQAKARKKTTNGICLEISGRVQHDTKELANLNARANSNSIPSNDGFLEGKEDDYDCSVDYN